MANCRSCAKEIPEGASFCPWCGKDQQPKRSKRTRGNGTGTVYKRKSGRWQAEYTYGKTVDGKRDYDTKGGFRTKKEALDYLPVLASRKKVVKSTESIATLWPLYRDGPMTKLSDSKQRAYKIAYKRMEKFPIIHSDISLLSIMDLQKMVDETTSSYYPAHDMKILLSHLYKLACAQQSASINLAQYIAMPMLDATERIPYSEADIKKIWESYEAGELMAMFMLMMIYSGMMPGELLKLKAENIDLQGQQIFRTGLKTKERKTKTILIASFMIPVFQHAISLSKSGNMVEMSRDKFYSEYHAASARMGLPDLSPYSCRHSTATALALKEGVAAYVIQRVMRHANFSMTERYIHPGSEAAIEALDKLKPT